MSVIRELSLEFKGNRNYLHGTDIYEAMTSIASSTQNGYVQKILFRKPALRQLSVLDSSPCDSGDVIAQVHICSGAESAEPFRLWLVERDERVSERYTYDEARISDACLLDEVGKRISKERDDAFSLIEEIVASHKVLCNALFSEGDVHWLFSQLDLGVEMPTEVQELSIVNRSFLSGRMVVSEIVLDGIHVGSIRFIRS